MYRVRTEPGMPFATTGRGSRASRSRHHRKAARVLPLPVGAWMSVCRPAAISAQPPTCAGVGASNVDSNHARTAGLNAARASDGVDNGPPRIPRPLEVDQMFEFAGRDIRPPPTVPRGTFRRAGDAVESTHTK